RGHLLDEAIRGVVDAVDLSDITGRSLRTLPGRQAIQGEGLRIGALLDNVTLVVEVRLAQVPGRVHLRDGAPHLVEIGETAIAVPVDGFDQVSERVVEVF